MKMLVKLISIATLLALIVALAGCSADYVEDTASSGLSRFVDESLYGSSMVVRTNLDIETDDVESTAADIRVHIKAAGGTITQEEISTTDFPYGMIAVSVPLDQAETFLEALKTDFAVENIRTVAATEQVVEPVYPEYDYYDDSGYYGPTLTLEQLEAELADFQALESKDMTVSEHIELLDRIHELQFEISRYQAQPEVIVESQDYQQFNITLNGHGRLVWEGDFWRSTGQAAITSLQVGVVALVGLLMGLLPFAIVFALLWWLWLRKVVARRRARKAEEATRYVTDMPVAVARPAEQIGQVVVETAAVEDVS